MLFQTPHMLEGLRIVESRDIPRYRLPAEVIPGVPWPPGFKEDIDRWALGFLGTTNLVPPGQALVMGDMVMMRPEHIRALHTHYREHVFPGDR